jgi:metallophosphoesterase superfamily enzyme
MGSREELTVVSSIHLGLSLSLASFGIVVSSLSGAILAVLSSMSGETKVKEILLTGQHAFIAGRLSVDSDTDILGSFFTQGDQ